MHIPIDLVKCFIGVAGFEIVAPSSKDWIQFWLEFSHILDSKPLAINDFPYLLPHPVHALP